MIDALAFRNGTLRELHDLDAIKREFERGEGGLLWIHLHQCNHNEYEAVLKTLFRFHPLAIEDTLSQGYQAPKVDDFTDYLFLIAHAITSDSTLTEIGTTELNCFLGKQYLVTSCHEDVLQPVQTTWQRALRDQRILERGADFLLHALLDAVVDEYLPFLDRIDEEVDQLEDRIIIQADPSDLRRILQLKHMILAMRRVASPQREVMLRLSRGEFSLIQQSHFIYFRDIYDHLVRIADLSESVRDVVGSTLDTYLSVSSNKLNEVMKTLTMVSTIFLPLTLVTSLYGMNFDFMPELHWHYGYLMVWIIMGVIIVGMLWFFHRRRWL